MFNHKCSLVGILLLLFLLINSSWAAPKIIIDTDLAGDCDDAGALALAHTLADRGECTILGIAISVGAEKVAGTVAAINAYYGRSNLPIAQTRRNNYDFNGNFKHIPDQFHPAIIYRRDTQKVVPFYRSILARVAAKDKVKIITIGFLNNLYDLLRSGPDKYSPKSGIELVREKVDEWVAMGAAPSSNGQENYNFGSSHQVYGAAQYVVEHWPGKVTFSSLGGSLRTGTALQKTPDSNPVKACYKAYPSPKPNALAAGRPSWDPIAMLYAIRGTGKYFSLHSTGSISITPRGVVEWRSTPDKPQSYLQYRAKPTEVAQLINQLLATPPRKPTIVK